MAYDSVCKEVTYVVRTTGNVWFHPTISSSDAPEYTGSDKAVALDQCRTMSPLGRETVKSEVT